MEEAYKTSREKGMGFIFRLNGIKGIVAFKFGKWAKIMGLDPYLQKSRPRGEKKVKVFNFIKQNNLG